MQDTGTTQKTCSEFVPQAQSVAQVAIFAICTSQTTFAIKNQRSFFHRLYTKRCNVCLCKQLRNSIQHSRANAPPSLRAMLDTAANKSEGDNLLRGPSVDAADCCGCHSTLLQLYRQVTCLGRSTKLFASSVKHSPGLNFAAAPNTRANAPPGNFLRGPSRSDC